MWIAIVFLVAVIAFKLLFTAEDHFFRNNQSNSFTFSDVFFFSFQILAQEGGIYTTI